MDYIWNWHGFDNLWDALVNLSFSGELDMILMFLLVFAVVFAVLNTRVFKKQKNFTSVIIAVSIALLSTWYMSWEGFSLQVLTYNVFSLFFTAAIALVIMVYFIHKINLLPGFRRALVLLYGVLLYIVLQQQSYDYRFLGNYFDLALIIAIICIVLFDKSINDNILGNKLRRD
jgi:peptidoglycan/LPS O-acetylase OafA/YrhL